MLELYQEPLEALAPVAVQLGFSLTSEEDHLARFTRPDGWEITFGGGDPRDYPNLTIVISRRDGEGERTSYAISLLRDVFSKEIPPDRRRPSYENDVWLFGHLGERLFTEESLYSEAYRVIERRCLKDSFGIRN